MLGQAKHAWLGIAGLRARGHGAHFDEAEPQCGEGVDVRAILVQAGCKPDRVGEAQSHQFTRRIGCATGQAGKPATVQALKSSEREMVRALRIKFEQQ